MTLSKDPKRSSFRTITAFFDDRADADKAVARLRTLGLSGDAVRLVPGYEGDVETGSGNRSVARQGENFWDALRDLFIPDEDRTTYAEGLRRGGFLVTVTTTDALHESALDILDDEGTIDMDERAESWRSEGWTGASESASLASDINRAPSAQTRDMVSGAGAMTDGEIDGGEEVIPVVEENLRVGKRDVSNGRVRVRSYMVETPVSEQVDLREERVHVERRPVDRAVSDADLAFQGRTIVAEERAEEAVVSKEARVKEEVVLRKDS